ncbi:transmembrane sensor [Neorhizobium huautlense]|uniref:Transmembrane sensor n=1 Tax=Neorhizobium huautlense TaxID=67774 RepID=A0ABT9PMX2_9HYPH|nr:FecR family protein [Neorhizobium huautlense]MDP9835503.1 transmembrane sensor [Neorhizobium huautlense]
MAQPNETGHRASREEAAAWFARLQSDDVSAEDYRAHEAWMSACHENARQYLKLSAMWTEMDDIADPRKRLSVVRQQRRAGAVGRRSFLAGGAAAALAAGLVAVHGLPDVLTSDYTTSVAERRSITLDDGSIIDMDADTAIAVDFSSTARNLHLRKGRAFFKVAKDAGRPFSVIARNGRATALGTEFVVHSSADTITVAVVESRVSVSYPGASSAILDAGEKISYDHAGLGAVTTVDSETEIAWQRGKLIFEDVPLGQVVSDLNRYRRGIIKVVDSDLQTLRVSGIFDVTRPDRVLEAITQTLPVKALALTPYLILLHPA